MMQKIRILPDEMVNLIAAGDVVERPASVAKELLENSIDAGASAVEIEAELGGKRSITVRDDGCGMSRQDLLMSVQRHATSKLDKPSQLSAIESLGFRGEALPSIAAVSRMTILTCDGEGEACRLEIEGGVMRDLSPAARTRGTTVTVTSLFFNQPARRKFLRSEETELSWMERHVTALAFAHCSISVRFVHGGAVLFDLPASSLEERLRRRFQLGDSEAVLSAAAVDGGTAAELLVCPDRRYAGRTHGYCTVNGRPVNSRAVMAPVEAAFSGPAGHALGICRVSLPRSELDVNVHPAKLEVRFRNPSLVSSVVEEACRTASGGRRAALAAGSAFQYQAAQPSRQPAAEAVQAALDLMAPTAVQSPQTGYAHVLQAGRSYLVASVQGGIVVVDQHAAHERILFEALARRLEAEGEAPSQRLLLPETIELDRRSEASLREYDSVISRAGFEFSISGGTLTLTAVPEGVSHAVESLLEVLASLNDPVHAALPPLEQIAAAAACAGAVKFGDALSPAEAHALLEALFSTAEPFRCPHGRPTLVEISFDELSRRFGR